MSINKAVHNDTTTINIRLYFMTLSVLKSKKLIISNSMREIKNIILLTLRTLFISFCLNLLVNTH